MTLSEAKASVLYEAGREKRITLRNLIIVGILVLIGIFLGVKYLLPILSQQVTNVPTYVKFILPLALLLTIGYPLVRVWKIFKRREQVEEAFSLIAQGEECRITSETDDYLTVIPFGKRSRINMDPISYLGVTIKNKNYLLPVHYRAGSAEIKRVLTGADDGAYKEVMYELYNKPQANSLFDKAAERSEVDKAPITLKPVSEFRSFAQKELAPTLASMEKARSTNQSMFKGQTIIAIAFVVVMMILVFTGVINFSSQTSVLYFIIGFAAFGFLYSFLSMQHAKKKLAGTEDYTQLKTKIFSRIVHYISPDFQYIEKGHIGIGDLLASFLFRQERYDLTGGDQIVGHYNGIPFQSCNLALTYRPTISNEKEPDRVAFYGNYFVARSPKTFEHPIVIHPVKSFFGTLNDNDIAAYLNTGGERIRLEDPEFQKMFEVYCDDQVTARYVLTPAFMERLKKLNERYKGQVYIAINTDNIVIATNRGNVLSSVDSPIGALFQKIDLNLVTEVYEELVEQLQMIDTLKLSNQ
ncbi:DUF3137 domain-containing protein [Capnocytophaga gingivalis]